MEFGTPVIGPDLPPIAEMTADCPAWLYLSGEGPGLALAAAEAAAPLALRVPALIRYVPVRRIDQMA